MHWSDSINHGYTVNGLLYIEGEALLHWRDGIKHGTVKEFIVFTAFLEELLFVKM